MAKGGARQQPPPQQQRQQKHTRRRRRVSTRGGSDATPRRNSRARAPPPPSPELPTTVAELQARLRGADENARRRLVQEYRWILVSEEHPNPGADTWLEYVDVPPDTPVCAASVARALPELALMTIHVWMLPWSPTVVPSGLLQRIVGPPEDGDQGMTDVLTRYAAAAAPGIGYGDEVENKVEDDWLEQEHALRLALLAAHNHSRAYPWSSTVGGSMDVPPDAYRLFQTLSVFAQTAAAAAAHTAAAPGVEEEDVATVALPWQTTTSRATGRLATHLADLPGAARLLLMLPTTMLRRFARSAVRAPSNSEIASRPQRVAVLLRLVLGNDGAAPDRAANATRAVATAVLQFVDDDEERYNELMREACHELFSRPGSSVLLDHTLDAETVDELVESVHQGLLLNRDFLLGVVFGFRAPADAADAAPGGPLSFASGFGGALRLLAILNETLRDGLLTADVLARHRDIAETLATLPTVAPGLEGADAAVFRDAVEAVHASLAAVEDAPTQTRRSLRRNLPPRVRRTTPLTPETPVRHGGGSSMGGSSTGGSSMGGSSMGGK